MEVMRLFGKELRHMLSSVTDMMLVIMVEGLFGKFLTTLKIYCLLETSSQQNR